VVLLCCHRSSFHRTPNPSSPNYSSVLQITDRFVRIAWLVKDFRTGRSVEGEREGAGERERVGERAVLEEERLEEMGIAGFNETPALQRRQIQRSRNNIRVAPAGCVRLFLASKIWRYDGGAHLRNPVPRFLVYVCARTLTEMKKNWTYFGQLNVYRAPLFNTRRISWD